MVYDLGCSTGNTIIEILKLNLNVDFQIIGIDDKLSMLKIAKAKLSKQKLKKVVSQTSFHCGSKNKLNF